MRDKKQAFGVARGLVLRTDEVSPIIIIIIYHPHYLRRRLANAGIVTLGITLSRCVCVHRISLGGEGNALYLMLSICPGPTATA